MLIMKSNHRKIVREILQDFPYIFYAFGSRVKGTARELSDLDICFFDTIPLKDLSDLRERFEESNLPFTVDLVNWNRCSTEFKQLIKDDLVQLTPELLAA